MTIAIKRTRSTMAATALGALSPHLDAQAKNEHTNSVMQVLWSGVPLRSCSIAARGLWFDLMCVMHECEPYGHLVVNGTPMNVLQLTRIVGGNASVVGDLLTELLRAGVFSCKGKCIYSPEMVAIDEQGESN